MSFLGELSSRFAFGLTVERIPDKLTCENPITVTNDCSKCTGCAKVICNFLSQLLRGCGNQPHLVAEGQVLFDCPNRAWPKPRLDFLLVDLRQ